LFHEKSFNNLFCKNTEFLQNRPGNNIYFRVFFVNKIINMVNTLKAAAIDAHLQTNRCWLDMTA